MRIYLFILLITALITVNGYTADIIKIGVIINNTGVAGKFDSIHIKSLELAVDLLNDKGGVKGQSVEIIPFYSNTTSLGAKSAAEAW